MSPLAANAVRPAPKTASGRLRELFARPGIIRLIGAHNALGAKLAERAGFEGVWASGLELSTSFGVPDANILSMSDMLAAARSMAEATPLPVIADCDTGFGNSNNVIHMVRTFEAAGVAGVCIEDKLFPKVNSFVPGRQGLSSAAEFVGKITAAKHTQASSEFLVIARVEALIAGAGMTEALRRAKAYSRAGADAILIHSSRPDWGEILEFARQWDGSAPIVVVPTTYNAVTVEELQSIGVKVVIYANHGLRSSVRAMLDTYQEILVSGSTASVEDRIAPMPLVFELQGMVEMKRHEATYLREGTPVRAIIPAAGNHLAEGPFDDIAADIPIAMLDIKGKALLERQMLALKRCNITSVNVVSGYRGEQLQVSGISLTTNPVWQETGDLSSIMCAASSYEGRTLIAYADVLFDSEVIQRLLASTADLTLLVDSTFDRSHNMDRRSVDLLKIDRPKARRVLNSSQGWPALQIGKNVPISQANAEFCGIALFSADGFDLLREVHAELASQQGSFHEAESVRKASLTDLLQELIDRGQSVSCIETAGGWMEIRSFEDYLLACEMCA